MCEAYFWSFMDSEVILSLILLPDSSWLLVVINVKVLFIGQIDVFDSHLN